MRRRINSPCRSCNEDLDSEPGKDCDRTETHYDPEDDEFDDDRDDGPDFADPGGRSALRAATLDNPRDQPCPTCGTENVLTSADIALHYQCDRCADLVEGVGSPWGAP